MSLYSHQYVVLPPARGAGVKVIWDDGALYAVCRDCEVNAALLGSQWECPSCGAFLAYARGYIWTEVYDLNKHEEDYLLKQWLCYWTNHKVRELTVEVHK